MAVSRLEERKLRVEELKRAAVVRRDAIFRDGCAVSLGGIALVALPAILGIVLRYAAHVLVAVRLGKHRGGSDAHHLAVAFHYARVRYAWIG